MHCERAQHNDDPISHPVRDRARDGLVNDDMIFYSSGGVHAEVAITLVHRAPDGDCVSILFGEERLTLEFFDVESLERLRDVADEGARRLNTAIEANTHAEPRTRH